MGMRLLRSEGIGESIFLCSQVTKQSRWPHYHHHLVVKMRCMTYIDPSHFLGDLRLLGISQEGAQRVDIRIIRWLSSSRALEASSHQFNQLIVHHACNNPIRSTPWLCAHRRRETTKFGWFRNGFDGQRSPS